MKNGLLITMGVALWAALKGAAKLIKAIIAVLTNVFIFFGLYIPLFYILFGVILLTFTDFSFGGMGTNQILYFIGLGLCVFASAVITFRTLVVRPLSAVIEPIVNYIRDLRERRAERRAEREGIEEGRYPSDERDYRRDRGDYDYERDDYRAPRGRYADPASYEDRLSYEDGRGEYRRFPPRDYYAPQCDYREDARNASEAYSDPYAAPRDYGPDRPAYGYPADQPRYGAPAPHRSEPERPLIYYSRLRPGILVKEYSDRFELYREDANGRVHVGTEYKDE